MSDPGGNDAILFGALKNFKDHWVSSAGAWRDSARAEFEKEYILDLMDAVRSASDAISQIETLLRQVRKECS